MCLCGMVVVCMCYASCVWGDGGFYLCGMHGVWWVCVFVYVHVWFACGVCVAFVCVVWWWFECVCVMCMVCVVVSV